MIKKIFIVSFVIFLISCTNSNNEEANSSNQNIWNISDGVEFPANRPLSRAEDGVFLNDGTLIVADQRYGLAKIEVDGTVEPFGKFDGAFKEDYEFVTGSGDLDECNGKFVDGQYKYFATDSFPFFPRCHWGEISRDFIQKRK